MLGKLNNPTEWEFGFATDVGRKRKGKPNQDALDVVLPDETSQRPPLLIIADGLGGYQGGETASNIVIQIFRGVFTAVNHPTDYGKLLELCARKAHEIGPCAWCPGSQTG